MEIVTKLSDLQTYIEACSGMIAFVGMAPKPRAEYHQGHHALFTKAHEIADHVIVMGTDFVGLMGYEERPYEDMVAEFPEADCIWRQSTEAWAEFTDGFDMAVLDQVIAAFGYTYHDPNWQEMFKICSAIHYINHVMQHFRYDYFVISDKEGYWRAMQREFNRIHTPEITRVEISPTLTAEGIPMSSGLAYYSEAELDQIVKFHTLVNNLNVQIVDPERFKEMTRLIFLREGITVELHLYNDAITDGATYVHFGAAFSETLRTYHGYKIFT